MESNSDKAMRDKLQGVEVPFDPAAWEQMEAMLDKKEKKRGFFWLWFSAGMAALLLLTGAGAYLSMYGESDKQLALAKEQTSVNNAPGNTEGNEQEVGGRQSAISNQEVNTVGSRQLNEVGNKEGKAVSNEGESNSIGKAEKANNSSGGNTNNTRHKLKANRNTFNGKQTGAASTVNTTKMKQRNTESAEKSTTSTGNQQPVTGKGWPATRNSQPSTGNPSLLTDFNGKPINGTTQVATPEAFSADKYWLTHLNPAEEEYNLAKHEGDDQLPTRMRAKVFQYSIGALGNVSAAMVKENTSSNAVSTTKPSSMGGFTHDFLFAGRFAISNSILYSQSNFKVSNVRSQSFDPAPISFNCRITEVAIPIGIKVYPVSTPKFRFYLSAGVINHIKLSETFTYNTVAKIDSGISSAIDIKNTYPTTTSFDGTGNGAVETYDSYTLNPANTTSTKILVNTNDFSINNAKRYYASFYAGAGVEGIIKNKWILFAEPNFNMSLQKIGIQERRKYNVGANLGFRYQF